MPLEASQLQQLEQLQALWMVALQEPQLEQPQLMLPDGQQPAHCCGAALSWAPGSPRRGDARYAHRLPAGENRPRDAATVRWMASRKGEVHS